MAETHTGLACPFCIKDGKGEQPLFHAPGVYGAYCKTGGHLFRDTEDLMAMNPPKIKIPQAPKGPNPGEVPETFQMSSKLRDALILRFGERLGPTANFILSELLNYGSFVVSEADAGRLKEHIGEIRNSNELVGAVYEIRQKNIKLSADLETAQSTKGGGKGLNVELDINTLMQVAEKAKFNNVTIDQMAANIIETGVKNQWV